MEDEDRVGLVMRLRIWWHNRTHHHLTATHDGLAEIEFRTGLLSRVTRAVITFPAQEGLEPVLLHDVGPTKAEFILSATTSLDLRRRAVAMGAEGVKR